MKILTLIIFTILAEEVLAQDHKHHIMSALAPAIISGDSIFNFEGKFTDQNNKKVVLRKFSNKKVLITMAYTSCQFSCPIIVGTNWHFLRAETPDDVQEISAILGVSYKAESDGEFSHSNVISLLDSKGIIKYQLIGMNSDTTELFNKLKEKK